MNYGRKLAEAQSKVASFSAENKSLPIQIFAIADEAKKDKNHLKTLEKNIDIEKVFSKLKDKKIDEALMKVEKADFKSVEKFKVQMSSQTSSAIITWMVSTSFVSTWPSITLSWISPNLIWKKWRRKFWQVVLLRLQRKTRLCQVQLKASLLILPLPVFLENFYCLFLFFFFFFLFFVR